MLVTFHPRIRHTNTLPGLTDFSSSCRLVARWMTESKAEQNAIRRSMNQFLARVGHMLGGEPLDGDRDVRRGPTSWRSTGTRSPVNFL